MTTSVTCNRLCATKVASYTFNKKAKESRTHDTSSIIFVILHVVIMILVPHLVLVPHLWWLFALSIDNKKECLV